MSVYPGLFCPTWSLRLLLFAERRPSSDRIGLPATRRFGRGNAGFHCTELTTEGDPGRKRGKRVSYPAIPFSGAIPFHRVASFSFLGLERRPCTRRRITHRSPNVNGIYLAEDTGNAFRSLSIRGN